MKIQSSKLKILNWKLKSENLSSFIATVYVNKKIKKWCLT